MEWCSLAELFLGQAFIPLMKGSYFGGVYGIVSIVEIFFAIRKRKKLRQRFQTIINIIIINT